MPALSIVVTGRVQGVGFRAFTQRTAEELGICGEVWNRFDGAVEATAIHVDSEVLRRFLVKLQNGPGYVEDVSDVPLGPARNCTEFTIGPTRP